MRAIIILFFTILLLGTGCAVAEREDVPQALEQESESSTVIVQDTLRGEEKVTEDGAGEQIAIGVNAEQAVDVNKEVKITLESGNFFFKPNFIEVKPGSTVQVHIDQNSGLHTFVIDEINLKEQISTGASFEFTAPQSTGDYAYYCDIGTHRELGMEGVLRVVEE